MNQCEPSIEGNGHLRPVHEGASRTSECPKMISSVTDSDNATISPAVQGSSDQSPRPKLAERPDLLAAFAGAIGQSGLVGEERTVKLLYLALVTRFFDRQVSVVVKGPSSAGKSYVVDRVLSFFPESAYYSLTAMSERSLAYGKEPLMHRFLVFYEAAGMTGEIASYLLRSLLTEGRIRYETVLSTKDKGLVPLVISREGPTGVILTTTSAHLHPENETRLLTVHVTDSHEHTARILASLADETTAAWKVDPAWIALQDWLATAERRVVIPYRVALVRAIPPLAVRLRRDIGSTLRLIQAHAMLHQANRRRDQDARIIAELKDYEAVRELVGDLIAEGIGTSVKPTVRATVIAVGRLIDEHRYQGIMNKHLVEALGIDKGAVSKRVNAAIDAGYLVNRQGSRGRPSCLELGEPLPQDRQILPSADSLDLDLCGCMVDRDSGEVAVSSATAEQSPCEVPPNA
jgi:hypothetical protein